MIRYCVEFAGIFEMDVFSLAAGISEIPVCIWRVNMIEVRLFATFREGRGKILQMDAAGLEKASDVLELLHIPREEVAIYLINGRHSALDDRIQDGDVLAIFPPVGGG